MTVKTKQILADALALPVAERAALADELLTSLGESQPEVDAAWAAEAEARVSAFELGNAKAIPAEEVFAELDHR